MAKKKQGATPKKQKHVPPADDLIRRKDKRIRILLLLIVVVTFICFSPILKNDFVNIDDEKLITENILVSNGSMVSIADIFTSAIQTPHYKPFVILTWNLEYRAFGFDPFWFHFNNLILHILNCILVFFLCLTVCRHLQISGNNRLYISFFIALIFGIHPMHVESVAWATERKDVMFSLFFLAGILTYFKYLEVKSRSYIWLCLSVICYLLSILSKTAGITLFAVYFLVDYLVKRKLSVKLFLEKIPFLAILIFGFFIYGLTSDFQEHAAGIADGVFSQNVTEVASNLADLPSFYKRILIICYRFLFWIVHTLMPVKLSIVYPRNDFIEMIGPVIHILPLLILFLAFLTIYYRKRSMLLVWGVMFYFINISPALSKGDVGISVFLSDRYTYIPSIGIFFVVVAGIYILADKRFPARKYLKETIMIIIVFLLCIGCYRRSGTWRTSETLFMDVVEKFPGRVPVAYNNLGLYYRKNNNIDKAIAYYEKTIAISPDYYLPYNNLGKIYFEQGNDDLAIEYFNKAIELDPEMPSALSNRGSAYGRKKNYERALEDMNKAVEVDPGYYISYKNRGLVYSFMNKHDLSKKDYSEYLKFQPADYEILNARGVANQHLKENEEAIKDFNLTLKYNPQFGLGYLNRSYSYYALGKKQLAKQDAIRAQQMGVKVNPEYLKLLE